MVGMRPYSEDLRARIVAAVESGMPKTEAARTFGVSPSSVKRYCRLAANEEPLAPRKGGGRPPKTNAVIERLLREARSLPPGVRGRDGREHLALAAVRMVEGGRAPAGRGPEELGQERHAALQYDAPRHGTVRGGGGGNHEGGLRGLRRAGAGSEPLARSGDHHGQSLRPQGGKGTRARRGGGMRAALPAALLPGHEPYRGGLLEGEGDLAKSSSPNPRNADRSHETGAGVGGRFGRPRLLRTPRVPRCYGSTVLTDALEEWEFEREAAYPVLVSTNPVSLSSSTIIRSGAR